MTLDAMLEFLVSEVGTDGRVILETLMPAKGESDVMWSITFWRARTNRIYATAPTATEAVQKMVDVVKRG